MMRPVKRAVIGSFVALAALVLVACGDKPATSVPGLFFPTGKDEQGGAMMDALYRGPLVVRDGCVLIGHAEGYALPVWWKGFTAERNDEGKLAVRDGDGAVIAIEGETFEMGGGYTAEFGPAGIKTEPRAEQIQRLEEWLGYPIPERCLGPDVGGVWGVGSTDPLPPDPSPS